MKKVGIWLDQKEANIITLENDSFQLKSIYSDIETRERFDGESKIFGRFGDQYLNNEKTKENKIKDLTQKYLNEIINELKNIEEVMLFGPAQTKIILEKMIANDHYLVHHLKDVITTANMSKNQKVAYVKKYFNN